MGYTIEGSADAGFRVIDDESGPLTGRKATEADALAAAGVKAEPKKAPAKKAAASKSSK